MVGCIHSRRLLLLEHKLLSPLSPLAMRRAARNRLWYTLRLHILLTCRLAGRSRVQDPQASPPRRGQKHCEDMGWGGLFLALRDSKRYWHFRGARHLSLFIWTFRRRLRKQTRRDSEMQWLQQGIGGRRRSCRRRIQNNYKSS